MTPSGALRSRSSTKMPYKIGKEATMKFSSMSMNESAAIGMCTACMEQQLIQH